MTSRLRSAIWVMGFALAILATLTSHAGAQRGGGRGGGGRGGGGGAGGFSRESPAASGGLSSNTGRTPQRGAGSQGAPTATQGSGAPGREGTAGQTAGENQAARQESRATAQASRQQYATTAQENRQEFYDDNHWDAEGK